MVPVIFEVTVFPVNDRARLATFERDVEMSALPPNITQTAFKVIPGVGNELENVSLTWNWSSQDLVDRS